jgi:hypothetical protein
VNFSVRKRKEKLKFYFGTISISFVEYKLHLFKNQLVSYLTSVLNLKSVLNQVTNRNWYFQVEVVFLVKINAIKEVLGAGATFDWTFFDNSKLINFDD